MIRFPLVRLTIFFALGIAFQKSCNFPNRVLWISALAFAVTFLIVHLFVSAKKKLEWVGGITAAMLFFCVGAVCLPPHDDRNAKNHYTHQINEGAKSFVFQIAILEKLKSSSKSSRYICLVEKINHVASQGKILVLFPKHDNPFASGQRLRVSGFANTLLPPLNPNQFDYGAYLENKGVFAKLYANGFTRIGMKKDIWHYADKLRNRILANVSTSGFGKVELPVFAALMLGQQQEIDAGIVRNYQYSGAVHVLSVSGLHVGFLMLMLQSMLGFLPNSRHCPIFKLCIVLLSLWSFAFVAGLSASVVRSVVMFSFVALGMHLKRSTNIFNTLFASMLLILMFKPTFLFDIGFQLSYLAVFFIVWLKPIFDRYWYFRNRLGSYFSDILSVSFAAQIGTLPLSLYYFHQFPLLFFVTNLIILPALGILMALGLATLVWACFAEVPVWLGFVTSKGIWLLDEAIAKIASYEHFVFTNVGFSLEMLIASYLMILCCINLAHKLTFRNIAIAMTAILVLQACFLWYDSASYKKTEMIVFHTPKNTVLTHKQGNSIAVYTCDTSDLKTAEFLVQPYATQNRSTWKLQHIPNALSFLNRRILVVDSSGIYPQSAKPELMILSHSPKANLSRMLKKLKPSVVIADGSNPKWNLGMWKQTCAKQKIPFHATAEKGSYILKSAP